MTSRTLRRLLATATLVAVLIGGCSSGGGADVEATGTLPETTSTTEAPFVPERSPLADQVRPAGSAATAPDAVTGPLPSGLRFDAIGADAPIVDVGVAADGQMEIPGASEVGWYRFGPIPGAAGSSVLAAHVAWNGTDGVFRRLTAAAPGDRFSVTYDDGSAREFEVAAVRQYPKDQLPVDEIFAADGPDQLVLVTCGGSFNRQISSYHDNIVAYAVAV